MPLKRLLREVRACRICEADLPFGPRPVLQLASTARILIIGQAPGSKVHQSAIPWNDASGDRLRDWLKLDRSVFYDAARVAILPVGFCYPGAGESGGDKPPRPECAPLWHTRLLKHLPDIRLTLLLGQYAQRYYLASKRKDSMTETVQAFSEYAPYNPYSYQNGSVWPHDNGFIALGFRRYGFAAEAARVARDVSGAGGYFMQHQMPELYAGLQRSPTNFPVQYLGANVPQAWAAGSAFCFLQALLGFQPDAPNDRLYIDPLLPEWLPDITVMDLRVGQRSFDVHFWRDGDKTQWKVLKGDRDAVARRDYASGPDLKTGDSAALNSTAS